MISKAKLSKAGFTLIELSIVLVIIGLIIGGILVGQDLIKAAEVRAQVSQIEKYNSAVNTFRAKFGAIPGDIALSVANQFGFSPGGGCTGALSQRDGNGLLDGFNPGFLVQAMGETGLFWQDLTSSSGGNLIDGQFPNSGGSAITCTAAPTLSLTTGTAFVGDYFPTAKIGHGNFLYVYEISGYNWYGLAAIINEDGNNGAISSNTTIPVIQAYNIDKKTDDGLPTAGVVQAVYILSHSPSSTTYSPNGTTDSTSTCYNTTTNTYSLSSLANYGAGGNCALSFKFQ